MSTYKAIDSTTNMCDYCTNNYPACVVESDVNTLFGDGIGEDNIIQCDAFDPIEDTLEIVKI